MLTSASLAVHAIGQGPAQATGKLGVKQVDRPLSNEGIDREAFFGMPECRHAPGQAPSLEDSAGD